ncbi:hypothetical protein ACB092_10G155600 [Castanea dentata]
MKRKYVEGGREESAAIDEEEEKINTFFTLVRNIRDTHNQLLMRESEEKGKGKGKEQEKEREMKSAWTPSFKWEDFEEDVQLRNNSVMPPSSSKKEEHCKTEEQEELDLNLSL